MIHDRKIVDTIERANDARPFCACGRHTTPVWRDGAVWLDCVSLGEPREGHLARILATLMAPTHTHDHIVDVPPFTAARAVAGRI